MRRLATGLAVLLLSGSAAFAQDVLVGGEADYDACGSVGVVSNLNPNGDNYLSVRSRPSTSGAELDRLGPGTQVYICDNDGRWIGIVYGDGDCGVSSPIAQRRPYFGTCASGWVFDAYIRNYAG